MGEVPSYEWNWLRALVTIQGRIWPQLKEASTDQGFTYPLDEHPYSIDRTLEFQLLVVVLLPAIQSKPYRNTRYYDNIWRIDHRWNLVREALDA